MFLKSSGEKIKVYIQPYPAKLRLFEKVGELMQSFYPEALELED